MENRLAAQAILTGYIRCEFFDAGGRFIGHTSCRIKALRQASMIEVTLPIPHGYRLARIVLTY